MDFMDIETSDLSIEDFYIWRNSEPTSTSEFYPNTENTSLQEYHKSSFYDNSTIISRENGTDVFEEYLNDAERLKSNYIDLEENISFKGHLPHDNDKDGYIPDGNITLERTVSGNIDSFKVYEKDGGHWVHEGGRWIRIDGSGTVIINGVKYDKI